MKTYLVTGASGFIGANFIKYLLYKKYKNEDIKVIVLDLLTYAGNLGTIKNDIDNKWNKLFRKMIRTVVIRTTSNRTWCMIRVVVCHNYEIGTCFRS